MRDHRGRAGAEGPIPASLELEQAQRPKRHRWPGSPCTAFWHSWWPSPAERGALPLGRDCGRPLGAGTCEIGLFIKKILPLMMAPNASGNWRRLSGHKRMMESDGGSKDGQACLVAFSWRHTAAVTGHCASKLIIMVL
jgi:hypothetical protein